MPMYAAHFRFDPTCGDAWTSFLEFSGFHHIAELVSTDEMVCENVVEELLAEDWQHNIDADYQIFFFRDLDYLKRRIAYDPRRHNLLSIVERPALPTTPEPDFEFCGYDILDSFDSVSVLTNCGPFPGIFEPAEVNRYGLLNDLSRANEIAEQLRAANPQDAHCRDCRVWSLCRYVGPQ